MASSPIEVYLEIGKKRTFAGALDWPGWCRSGRGEEDALEALLAYGPRYARTLQGSGLAFESPSDVAAFTVVERLEGNATTDFGAPDMAPSSDQERIDDADLKRFQALFQAYWRAFDAAVAAAEGKALRKGPRGGGRELEGIIRHVMDAERGYLSRLAWKEKRGEGLALQEEVDETRQAILKALEKAASGELPERGPRGGVIWKPRYFVRRVAWHLLDHLWEIEDRVI